jgi:uridine kinase
MLTSTAAHNTRRSPSVDSMTRSVCVEQLATAIAVVRLDHPTRVAIDGVDGVGKTTLAEELVEPLRRKSRQVIRASVDGFHRPRAVRYQRGVDSAEGYFLDSFDYPVLRSELLDPLGPRGSRRFRSAAFDHRADQPVDVPEHMAAPDAILLFDGVFLQRPELAGSWDVRVWVDAPFHVTVPRAVNRDAAGSDRVAVIQTKYDCRYVPGQLQYFDRCRPRDSADIIFDNTDVENPEMHYRKPRRDVDRISS